MAKVTLKPTQAEEPMPEVPLDERLKINCNIATINFSGELLKSRLQRAGGMVNEGLLPQRAQLV